jgi:hypothetical protein
MKKSTKICMKGKKEVRESNKIDTTEMKGEKK